MATPLLGWIEPKDRTQEQHDAHHAAVRRMMAASVIPTVALNPGDKIMLTDFWKRPECIADIGFEFNGYRQLTGSCVGVSTGNWITTVSCVQRTIATNPTKAFACFWPFDYGRCRLNEGDRGQGEGAVDSVMGQTIEGDGYFDLTQPGLPTFDHSDGLALPAKTEMQYSDGASSLVTKWIPLAKQHVGAKAICKTPDDIANAIANGYPVIDGCDMYIGNGSIKGSGADACVVGHYDGRGGHSTCFLGVWMHPTLGMLFLYSNQWDGSTYPTDPAGAGRCCVWAPESEVQKGFSSYGMDGGETMALSHVDWFPSQSDKILDLFV